MKRIAAIVLALLTVPTAFASGAPQKVSQPDPAITKQEAHELLVLLQSGQWSLRGSDAAEFVRLEVRLNTIANAKK